MKKINLGQKELIHFVGIGGIGMSGLAQIMKNNGFTSCSPHRPSQSQLIKLISSLSDNS